jgi:hypothetical protein
VTLPTTTELLLAWDRERPRSKQVEIGMSQLGACRRQTGYMLGGYPEDEGYEDARIQAVMGSAIHLAASLGADWLIPEVQAETIEVRFGGLLGHPDLWVDGVVRDIKTVSYTMMLEQRRLLGPPLRERYQVHTYGAGLILAGYPVHTVQIDYIDRGSGEEFLFEEPFSPEVVSEAMAWLEQVRTAEVAILPRDYRPESAFCQSCPFFRRCWDAEPGRDPRSVLFTDDPDAAAWGLKLEDAQARKKQAEADEADAKGALDALRTVSRPGEKEYVKVPGLEREIRFSVSKGRTSPDMPRIAVDYANAGARPPMRTGEPVISVRLVKPREERE